MCFFANAVQPILEATADRESLLRLLLRMDAPFNRSFLSRRVLFIVKLACVTHSDWAPIRAQLKKIEGSLRNDAYLEKYSGSLIDDIYAYFVEVRTTGSTATTGSRLLGQVSHFPFQR